MKEQTIYQKFISFLTRLVLKIPMPHFLKKLVSYKLISYLFVGTLTTIVNWTVYFSVSMSLQTTQMEHRLVIIIAEIVSFILSVLFSYFPNKVAVFDNHDFSFKKVAIEMFLFYASRVFALLAELLIILVTVTALGLNEPIMKILASVVVVILNYIFSKFFVFKKTTDKE